MNILGWVVWTVAMLIFIVHIFLFFHSDPGVSRLAKRFSFLIAIGLAITAFTKLSKFHLIWWIPVAYFFNLWTFAAGVQRGAKKFIKKLEEEHKEEKRIKRSQAMMLIGWLVISAILIAVWEVLVRIIPEGWALVPVNIFCFLVSCAIVAFGYLPTFRRWMREPLAWLCAFLLWLLIFVGIRSLL